MTTETTFRCKLCHGVRHRRRYRLGLRSAERFTAAECADCGLFQVVYPWWDAPPLEMTHEFDHRGRAWSSPQEMAANRAKAQYFAGLLQERGGIAGKRILDLGSGKGFFLRACLDRGAAHVTGLEFRAADMTHAREAEGVEDIRATEIDRADTWPDAEFDAACSFDVLEHVHDLGSFLGNAIRVTRSEGLFFHATPGYDSLSHRIGRALLRLRVRKLGTVLANVRGVQDFSGGTHVSILGREQVMWIGRRYGLESVVVAYVPSYSYSDRHYAEVVPVLNRLPRPIGSLLFKVVRRANRNKLVWVSRIGR